MTETTHSAASTQVAATSGNPDGKGVNAFALDWQKSAPRGVVAKRHTQVLAEFFTSMLILSASFKFRPVPGESYYLYYIHDEWCLSLIAPHEWSNERQAAFAGTCMLQRDMTWTIEPSTQLSKKNPVSEAMSRFYNAFASTLDTDRVLEDILPFFIQEMPYYQRLYASGLSRSLLASVKIGNQTNTSANDWQAHMPSQRLLVTERSQSDPYIDDPA